MGEFSDDMDIGGAGATGSLSEREGDSLSLLKVFEAGSVDFGAVEEQVIVAAVTDEACPSSRCVFEIGEAERGWIRVFCRWFCRWFFRWLCRRGVVDACSSSWMFVEFSAGRRCRLRRLGFFAR